ncbi:hypothetical protein [Acidovorax sp. SUPP3334]|uniref:hypothetical protein n=1 Tax=Acidovorax sp. SUPP3334 TaxID=2920881 RepID=UPI0023DE28D6|nr:hypothetical protein [Acidovorax sp. SUPP3334]GKT25506.1 hypothetical protein AVHM3334_18140 [Acidovorax sp. SUPP3334]
MFNTNKTPAPASRRWLAAAPLIVVSALALTACDRNKPADTPTNSAPAATPAPTTPATPAPTTPATPSPVMGASSASSSAPAGGAVFGGSKPAPATSASEPASDAK